MQRLTTVRFILLSLVFILLSHYLVVFFHEYSHSFVAWILGYKTNPLALGYGGTSFLNLLLLSHIDENVNYAKIYAAGHPTYVSLIAFAGSGIANSLLFLWSYFLLKNKKVQRSFSLFYFIFLFNLMNLGNLYDYVPIRTFAGFGDVYNFVTGLSISPWWVYIIFGYIIAFLVWQFLTKTLISAFIHLHMTKTVQRASLMIICVCILFGFFGGFPYIYFAGQSAVGDITYFLSLTSFISIPGLLIALWPTRAWVKRRLNRLLVTEQ